MRKFAILAILLIFAVIPFAFAPSAAATQPVRTSFSFTADPITVEDICSFPVTVISTLNGTETDFFDSSGAVTMVLIHSTEQDTFTANGKSLTGFPYTFEIQILFDESGNVTHVFASGVVEMLTLPDGTLFISAGRVDFAAHPGSIFVISPDVGVSGDVDAFCGFFADP